MQPAYAEGGYFESDPDQLCSTEKGHPGEYHRYEHCPKGSLIYIGSEATKIFLYPELAISTWCDLTRPVVRLPIPHTKPINSGILCISRGKGRKPINKINLK